MTVDVVIVGGGPAGLTAALNLGRARKRVLLCDAGPRRNAAAKHIHGFVTQDGTPPEEFRRVARAQLERYTNVEPRDVHVETIRGARGAFEIGFDSGETVSARRILLCTGMIDELPEIDGVRALWGRSILICPYCHGWEVRDRAFGFLAPRVEMLEFAIFLRGWSHTVTVLTNDQFAIPPETRERLHTANVSIDERTIAQLAAHDSRLARVEFTQGDPLPLDVLFVRPPQRQVPVVESLGLALDGGYVRVDDHRQTTTPGIYAAGDLMMGMQSATLSAAAGAFAAATLNHDLTIELALSGELLRA